MTVCALFPAADPGCAAPAAIDRARLAAANINPATGLANDYLNHFNAAIMLLELLAMVPDCSEDLMAWRPMSYREHFLASRLSHRELAIAAYEAADPTARQALDELAEAMNDMLIAARDAVSMNPSAPVAAAVALEAAARLKLMVARAGAVINGMGENIGDQALPGVSQAAIDALMEC